MKDKRKSQILFVISIVVTLCTLFAILFSIIYGFDKPSIVLAPLLLLCCLLTWFQYFSAKSSNR